MEESDGKEAQVTTLSYLEIYVGKRGVSRCGGGSQERRFMTDMRGGTNLLRVEMGRWKGEQLEDRTCIFCAMGVVEDEAHALLQCSTYYRERYQLYVHIRNRTDSDVSKMQQDQDWLLQMLLGVGCPGKKQRADIQSLVANYVGNCLEHVRDSCRQWTVDVVLFLFFILGLAGDGLSCRD